MYMSTQLCTRVSFIGQRMRYTRILLRIGCIHFQFHDYRLIRSYTTDIHNTQCIFLFGWSMVVAQCGCSKARVVAGCLAAHRVRILWCNFYSGGVFDVSYARRWVVDRTGQSTTGWCP